jgi:hypothetical protein
MVHVKHRRNGIKIPIDARFLGPEQGQFGP